MHNIMPDLTNMGAKDAVYLAEKLGLKVQINGYGKLISQSILAVSPIQKGQSVLLNFQE